MDRRRFLAAGASGLLASCEFRDGIALPPGDLSGPDMRLGHLLRDGKAPAPVEERRVDLLIVGAGVGGLAAAWHLARRGHTGFTWCELDTAPGGNARFGESSATAYPLGAHYLPLPTREAVDLRDMLADLGILEGDPHAEVPRYGERHLVGAPQERIYAGGLWYDGLTPRALATARDTAQLQRFDEIVEGFRRESGADGRRRFAIPSPLSLGDDKARALDSLSMADWLRGEGLDAPQLHWLVDYACRDDYGAKPDAVSAWAALHYFASRNGQARDADPHSVLTWPEGNGALVRRLLAWLKARGVAAPQTSAACTRLETARGHALADIHLGRENRTVRYRADRVIWAAPAHALAIAWSNAQSGFRTAAGTIVQSPWLVANLHVERLPGDAGPAGMAWDNVIRDSPALGYVVATHQTMAVAPGPSVLTYYWPLAEHAPQEARRRLAETSWQHWTEAILAELDRPHPGLREVLRRLDLWRWPHAMPRPVPGFRSAPIRALLADLRGPLLFAHSDSSGMPLFEEAHHAGVRAANLAA